MRRIGTYETRVIHTARLYLEDYYELVSILQREDFKLDITADQYRLEEPGEIVQFKQPIVHKLKIVSEGITKYSRLDLAINAEGAAVSFEGAPSIQYSKALELLDFLEKRRSKFSFAKKHFANPFTAFLAFPPILFLVYAREAKIISRSQSFATFLIAAMFFVGTLSWSIWSQSELREKRGVALVLKERSEKGSFFERHKDGLEKLFIGVVSAIAGALVKAFFDKN